MAQCIYCHDRSGFISQVCKDCRQLIGAMKQLGDNFGYRVLLDALIETRIHPDKIERFLDADPDGDGSLNQKITARMTNQLMNELGQPTQMSGSDVKDIQRRNAAGESFLSIPDVVAPNLDKSDLD